MRDLGGGTAQLSLSWTSASKTVVITMAVDEDKERAGAAIVLFWSGIYSQWHQAPFRLEGQTYANAEQYMMAQKALLFGDHKSFAAIMKTRNAKKIKALGRGVQGFDPTVWDEKKLEIVIHGNLAKFAQNPLLKAELLSTGHALIAEASPDDSIWGIGLSEYDVEARDPSKWRGTNLLGEALMKVRDMLRDEGSELEERTVSLVEETSRSKDVEAGGGS